jgi:hypothetical protein
MKRIPFEQTRTVVPRYAQDSMNVAKQYTYHEENEADNDDDQDNEDYEDEKDDKVDEEDTRRRIIREYIFGLKEFNMLLEKLPMDLDEFVLKLDLWDGYLSVRTVPGHPHAIGAGVFSQQMLLWSQDVNNITVAGQPLYFPIDSSKFGSPLIL